VLVVVLYVKHTPQVAISIDYKEVSNFARKVIYKLSPDTLLVDVPVLSEYNKYSNT